jgi:tetratricopeptide (TPR) repeat protein
MCGN